MLENLTDRDQRERFLAELEEPVPGEVSTLSGETEEAEMEQFRRAQRALG